MKIEELRIIFEEIGGKKRFDEPMRNYTSFRIGGTADLLIFPENTEDLKKILYLCSEKEIPVFILGFGTNLLVKDGGIRGVVINLNKGFRDMSLDEKIHQTPNSIRRTIIAGGGAGLQKLVGFALKNKLSGMEFAAGIPGSIGGALIMNAGAKDGEIKNVVKGVKIITANGETKTIQKKDIGFSYRHSEFPANSIILEASILLKNGKGKDIKKKMELLVKDRKSKQPLSSYSAGSVFKNPSGDFAARLIESAGLKGFEAGDAIVSHKHANFIVNRGRATAGDVLKLIEIVKEKVFVRTGVLLKEEIRIVGEDYKIVN
ncbi:MAG: UDP-N-acetylmuramate dehydrogenase [Nitrospinota bacterium]